MASPARIDELKKKFDENPRRYFAPLANEFRKAGDLDQAIVICEEFLPQQPGHMSGHIVYGQALFESNRPQEARTVFETALALDPENLIALRHLGDIARGEGDLVSARRWYDRVLDGDPRNEETQALIAALQDGGVDSTSAAAASSAHLASTDPLPEHAAVLEPAAPALPERVAEPAPPPMPEPAVAMEALEPLDIDLDLDMVEDRTVEPLAVGDIEMHGMPSASSYAEPIVPEPSYQESTSPPDLAFESLSFDEPPAMAAPVEEAARPTHAEGFEPAEFTPPAGSEYETFDFADELESAEFSAPSGDIAPLDGLEETAIGAFERQAEVSLGNAPPVELPPEVIAAEAVLMDDGDAGEPEPMVEQALELEPAQSPEQSMAPEPEPEPELEAEPEPESDGVSVAPQPPFVTETMAELYLTQGFREQALDVYQLLLAASPDNVRLQERVAELQPGTVVESGPTVREFFAKLAARRPGERAVAAAPPADDDFADFGQAETTVFQETVETVETVDLIDSFDLSDMDDASSTPMEEPSAATRSATPTGGTIDALFGNRGVGTSEDSAASALAQAFGGSAEPPPLSGRPARAAAGELSLDSVFRDGPRPLRASQSFSFDQFFSESASAERASDLPTAQTPTDGVETQGEQSEQGSGTGGGSGDDIEQFNSWLQGLKPR